MLLNSTILNSYLAGKYKKLRYIQRIYVSSLVVRFNVIRDLYTYHTICQGSLNINSIEKLHLAINIKLNRFTSFKSCFFVYSKKLFSLFFLVPNLYTNCIKSVFNNLILPIVNFKCDRFSYGFRPYRYSLDLFVQLKKTVKTQFIAWSLFSQINKHPITNWLSKNIFFEKRYIIFMNNDRSYLVKNHLLYFTLLNFSLSGLVRFYNQY